MGSGFSGRVYPRRQEGRPTRSIVKGRACCRVGMRARAIETGSFMISAAQGGVHEDGRETYGHSIIVDPWGRVLAEGGTEPGVILAEIDLSLVADARARIPSLRHARPFSVERIGAKS